MIVKQDKTMWVELHFCLSSPIYCWPYSYSFVSEQSQFCFVSKLIEKKKNQILDCTRICSLYVSFPLLDTGKQQTLVRTDLLKKEYNLFFHVLLWCRDQDMRLLQSCFFKLRFINNPFLFSAFLPVVDEN